MILDTSFLVALERESRRRQLGPASRFLATANAQLCITPIIAGELVCGTSLASRTAWESLLLPFQMLVHDAEVGWHYGTIFRSLSATGKLIGANDLWIAAAGLAHSLPVVTGNLDEFRRVPGLQVIAF